MSTSPSNPDTQRAAVEEAIADNWFCILATSSADDRPHAAGMLYALVGAFGSVEW